MKKICFVNPTVLLKRPISQLIERLGDEYSLTLFIPKKTEEIDNSLHYSKINKAKIATYHSFRITKSSEWPIPKFNFIKKSWNVLKENDIIHIWVPFYISSTFLAVLKMLFFRKKRLILTMDTIPAYSFSMGKLTDTLLKIYYKTIGKIVFSSANTITLYGDSMKPHAKKAGIPTHKIKITPTGTDTKRKKSDKDIRKEFGIKKDEKVVLFVGLLVPRKGIDIILKVASKTPHTKFILVGDSPIRRKYEEMAEKSGIKDRIIFTGFRRDVHNFYNQSDIFFFPSRGEGLSGAIMEAMTYGLPIVTSKIPCTTDLIENEKEGFLCDVEDVNCYRKKLGRLVTDEKLGIRISKHIQTKIKQFSWDIQIKNFEEQYI